MLLDPSTQAPVIFAAQEPGPHVVDQLYYLIRTWLFTLDKERLQKLGHWTPGSIEPEKYDAKTENQGKQKDTVRGQIPEHKMFQTLNEFFMDSKDDVLVIHSHKVLGPFG